MCAHQRKRELAGEQFIIGKPRPCRILRKDIVWLRWPVQMTQCRCKGGKPFARDPGFVLPFRQIRQTAQSAVHCAPDIAERQTFGERINRLDQRQRCKARLVHHAVGVNHLQHAVVEFGCAGDVAHFAHGQQLFQIIAVAALK